MLEHSCQKALVEPPGAKHKITIPPGGHFYVVGFKYMCWLNDQNQNL